MKDKLKFGDFTSLCRVPNENAVKCVSHAQHDYISSFNK